MPNLRLHPFFNDMRQRFGIAPHSILYRQKSLLRTACQNRHQLRQRPSRKHTYLHIKLFQSARFSSSHSHPKIYRLHPPVPPNRKTPIRPTNHRHRHDTPSQQLNDYVNARPSIFKLENAKDNLSHRYEKPGIDDLEDIRDDMEKFLTTGK